MARATVTSSPQLRRVPCTDVNSSSTASSVAGGRLFGGHDVLGVSIGAQWVTLDPVMSVPLVTWPIMTLSIILCILSIILTLSVLLHKSRGGGLSDLFGGGVSTSMGGTSVAERNLDRITIIVGLIWVACIIGLLFLYRYS